VRAQELRQRPHEHLLPEGVRHGHAQRALGLLLRAAQVGLERRPARQQLLGPLV